MKTEIGYKIFECKNGKLYPLFINKSVPTPIGIWMQAENKPTAGFAKRPGWHCSQNTPAAPWLMSADGTYKSRFKNGQRVWCEVEYDATNDYREEALKQPKKCFTDRIPKNGFYWFKEGARGTWVITSAIRVVRIIDEEERQHILHDIGYDEAKEFIPYRNAIIKRMKGNKLQS